jgi:hypothetical protein
MPGIEIANCGCGKLKLDILKLRNALSGMLGVSSDSELKEMLSTVELLPVHALEKATLANAAQAMLDTNPN